MFDSYWVISLVLSRSPSPVVLPGFDCFLGFFYLLIFFSFHHSTIDLLRIRFCDYFFSIDTNITYVTGLSCSLGLTRADLFFLSFFTQFYPYVFNELEIELHCFSYFEERLFFLSYSNHFF